MISRSILRIGRTNMNLSVRRSRAFSTRPSIESRFNSVLLKFTSFGGLGGGAYFVNSLFTEPIPAVCSHSMSTSSSKNDDKSNKQSVSDESNKIAKTPNDVLAFWFQCDDGSDVVADFGLWFGGGPDLDKKITHKFTSVFFEACNNGLVSWEANPRHLVAKIIILDQFSRNIHRGSAQAFATDALARKLSKQLIKQAPWSELHTFEAIFGIMPLMHSEDIEDHNIFARVAEELKPIAEATGQLQHLTQVLGAEADHRRIIEQFGRYPYRNEVLGRENTSEEELYLVDAFRYGQ